MDYEMSGVSAYLHEPVPRAGLKRDKAMELMNYVRELEQELAQTRARAMHARNESYKSMMCDANVLASTRQLLYDVIKQYKPVMRRSKAGNDLLRHAGKALKGFNGSNAREA